MNNIIKPLVLMMIIFSLKVTPQWVQTNGPYGGRVNCFTFISSSLYAGTCVGIYKSTNTGMNWTKIGLQNYDVRALTSLGSYLFAGTSYYGVFLSINDGNSWTQVNYGLTNKYVQALAVIGNNLFAGTQDGVFHSSNYGNNWNQVNNGLTNKNVMCLSVSGNNLFAGTNDGVFVSSNNGASWVPINSGIRNTTVFSIIVSGNNIYIATDSSGVMRSTNLGSSWLQTNLMDINVQALAINGTVLLAGTYGAGIFRSTNSGTTWTLVNNGLSNNYIFNFIIDNIGNIFSATKDGIFLSSNNGVSWIDRKTGLTTTINAMTFTGTSLFAGTDNGIFLTTNSGTSWVEVGLHDQFVYSFSVYGSSIFAGSMGVYISTDNGGTWLNRGLDYFDIYSIEIIYPKIYASNSANVYRSSFASTSWETVLNLYFFGKTTLAKKDTILFLGTSRGIYSSTNFGNNWQEIGFMNYVNTIAFSDTFILAGTSDGIYRKGLRELNWLKMAFQEGVRITAFAVSGNKLFAGTNNGIFLSENNGTSWIDVSMGLSDKFICCLSVGAQNLFAGTYAGGVRRRPLSEMVTDLDEPIMQIPDQFLLNQNYPNPFNPSTKISWQSPVSGHQTLKVYDILGNEVATLVDEYKSAGSYEVEFKSAVGNKQLASGVYFYQLRIGDPTGSGQSFIQTKKMLYLK